LWHYLSAQEVYTFTFYNQPKKQFRMNKIKWTLLSLAILLSIGGAFATRPQHKANGMVYYWNGFLYAPVAGQIGVDYICEGEANVCTYVFIPSTQTYQPLNIGDYTPAQ
jgi:hypothetical protein